MDRFLSTLLGLPWLCNCKDVSREYRGPVWVEAKVRLPHPIRAYLFEPTNCSPQPSWGKTHGRLDGFLKYSIGLVYKRLLLYVEVRDKAHRILVLVSGNPFIWERYAYKVRVAGTPGHLLEMIARNDVGRHVASFYFEHDVDYLWDEWSCLHGFAGANQLLVLWNIRDIEAGEGGSWPYTASYGVNLVASW